jgi:glycolate oxidase FAD binding subunit
MPGWLRDIVGTAHVAPPPRALRALDGVPIETAARPGSAAEVAACLRAASERGAALVPVGGSTQLALGNVARAQQLVLLDLSRLQTPVHIEAEEGVATVAAGVRTAALHAALRPSGKRALLEAGDGRATVGGAVAGDPMTLDRTLDRQLRHDLLGLQVALTNGTLARCGGRVVKNVTGFDLVRLHCGARGTLGVVTEVTLRLRPLPEARAVLCRDVADTQAALALASEIAAVGVAPAGIALVPHATMGMRLLWAVEGQADDVADRASRVRGEPASESDWDAVSQRMRAPVEPLDARVRLGARASDLAAVLASLAVVGGTLRVALPLLGVAVARVAAEDLRPWLGRCAEQRYAVCVEIAAPEVKADIDVFGAPPGALALMRSVKARFDPRGTLSPGRFMGHL